ncbi:MAG: hypothetical protein RL702_1466 [Pseudomonadota bacterium]|jgi:hypothetical protein
MRVARTFPEATGLRDQYLPSADAVRRVGAAALGAGLFVRS